jgi:hypothetical protein
VRPLVCDYPLHSKAEGRGGLAKTTMINHPCGEPATMLFRAPSWQHPGFLHLWAPRCHKHRTTPSWEARMREEYPTIPSKKPMRIDL